MLNKLKSNNEATTVVTQCSENDPNESVMNTSPWSFRLNNYHKDIIEAAAKKLGVSRQAYLRHAAIEYALTLDIS